MGLLTGEAFDGLDVAALRIDGEDGAGVDALAVEDDGAGSTGAAVADLLGAGVIQVIAQRVEQRDAGLDGEVDGLAVDVEGDGDGAGSDDIGGGGAAWASLSRRPVPTAPVPMPMPPRNPRRETAFLGLGSFVELTRHLPFRT